jgi:penicillin amidase
VYHPSAKKLMTAFVAGVNGWIAQHAGRLPIEFVVTGIKPEPWSIDTLLLRQNSFGDAATELQLARSAASIGLQAANKRRNPDPWDDLALPDGLDLADITEGAIAATRAGGRLPRPEILPAYRALAGSGLLAGLQPETSITEPGSNNWVVSGALSATGKPVVANDPHREVSLPSLRYIVHLNAPGWNVIGAVEPPFLGVAIGHNDRVAWGLTIVGTDQHDVYVEQVNPANPNEVRFDDRWEPLRVVRERIAVKGGDAVEVELKFSRHGPIFYEEPTRHRALALRSALHERGAAPYLAGLRLSQTENCRDFLDAAMFWYSPSENLICGDVDGNIAWQASALTPNRQGWVGRLPVPGTGKYEWNGFRKDLPRELNPARGFIATANHNVQPKGYAPPIMFKSADTKFERITRLLQLLSPDRKYSVDDHRRMQLDAFSLRAAADQEQFRGWNASAPEIEQARAIVAEWDHVYRTDSAAAAIYEAWRAQPSVGGTAPARGSAGFQAYAENRLRQAIERLTKEQGPDPAAWRWGRMHTRAFDHPFLSAFNLETVERPGGAGTVAADGASYREILDVADWDRSIATNTPGQSAQPGSPFYANLLPLWANDEYFPLAFSKQAVDRHAAKRLTLSPK